jgi:DNA polymerase-3 subunit delta'
MGFGDFLGNKRIVAALRSMLARRRVPHALLFAGPQGVGKFTLARMFAQAANCQRLEDDFCGECSVCRQVGELADREPLIQRSLAERGANPDPAKVDREPLIVQTHPDVWLLAPDPVRQRNPVARPMLRMGQLRAVQRAARFAPAVRRRVFLLDGAETMREADSNTFLKILEEPPPSSTLILLTENPDALLPTILSRCLRFVFAPVPAGEIEDFLKARTSLTPAARRQAAQLSGGCPGAALGLDIEESVRVRKDILRLLARAAGPGNFSEVFSLTAQLAKGERERFENLLNLFYSMCSDLLAFSCASKVSSLRNPDLREEIEALHAKVDRDWVVRAVGHLDELQNRLRRNSNRQLGLDAVVATLASP